MWGSCKNSKQTDSVSNSVQELTDRWKKRQQREREREKNKEQGRVVQKKKRRMKGGKIKTRFRKAGRQKKTWETERIQEGEI